MMILSIDRLSIINQGRVYLSAETTNEMNEWISQIRSVMTAVRSGGGGTRVANPIKSPQTSQPTTPVKKRPAPAKPIDAIAATVSYSVANNTLISSTTTSTTATGVNSYTFLSFFFFFFHFTPNWLAHAPQNVVVQLFWNANKSPDSRWPDVHPLQPYADACTLYMPRPHLQKEKKKKRPN